MRAMYQKDSRPELENKIKRYKALARQVPDDETAQNIRSLVAELERKLRQTGE
jgi:predicted site-specific integrase-resolvase